MVINIATDYSKNPGGRLIREGEYSGEDFRKKMLYPCYLESVSLQEPSTVNLDGGYGYGSSFLEEAFGGLARETKDRNVLKIKIVSNEEPRLIEDIKRYMEVALNEKKNK